MSGSDLIAEAKRLASFAPEKPESVHDVVCAGFNELLEQLEAAQGALKTWQAVAPAHRAECNPWRADGKGCTCGLQAARDITHHVLASSPARELAPSEPRAKETGGFLVETPDPASSLPDDQAVRYFRKLHGLDPETGEPSPASREES